MGRLGAFTGSGSNRLDEENDMKLEGIHHITAITADAQRNVDFYVGLLGLRLVKNSVNQDYTSV